MQQVSYQSLQREHEQLQQQLEAKKALLRVSSGGSGGGTGGSGDTSHSSSSSNKKKSTTVLVSEVGTSTESLPPLSHHDSHIHKQVGDSSTLYVPQRQFQETVTSLRLQMEAVKNLNELAVENLRGESACCDCCV